MMNDQINDNKLLGYLYPPEQYYNFLEEIERRWGYCSKWTMWQAYELGVMHGKRAERARRAAK